MYTMSKQIVHELVKKMNL